MPPDPPPPAAGSAPGVAPPPGGARAGWHVVRVALGAVVDLVVVCTTPSLLERFALTGLDRAVSVTNGS